MAMGIDDVEDLAGALDHVQRVLIVLGIVVERPISVDVVRHVVSTRRVDLTCDDLCVAL